MINKIYDFLYELWYGYRLTTIEEAPLLSFKVKEIEIKEAIEPRYSKPNATVKISELLTKLMNGPYLRVEIKPTSEDSSLYQKSIESKRIYIYNISPLAHEKDHSVFKHIVIPACPIGKPYELAFSLPEVMLLNRYSTDTEETRAIYQDGKRMAMDIINPSNLGLDQSKGATYSSMSDGSEDLGKRGVFWSLNCPPKKEELEAAKYRLENYYRYVLEKAAVKAIIFPALLEKMLEGKKDVHPSILNNAVIEASIRGGFTPEEHAAADYFRVKTSWHPVLKPKFKTQRTQ